MVSNEPNLPVGSTSGDKNGEHVKDIVRWNERHRLIEA